MTALLLLDGEKRGAFSWDAISRAHPLKSPHVKGQADSDVLDSRSGQSAPRPIL